MGVYDKPKNCTQSVVIVSIKSLLATSCYELQTALELEECTRTANYKYVWLVKLNSVGRWFCNEDIWKRFVYMEPLRRYDFFNSWGSNECPLIS